MRSKEVNLSRVCNKHSLQQTIPDQVTAARGKEAAMRQSKQGGWEAAKEAPPPNQVLRQIAAPIAPGSNLASLAPCRECIV